MVIFRSVVIYSYCSTLKPLQKGACKSASSSRWFMEKTDKYRFLIPKINLPSCGRANSKPPQCPLKAPCTVPQCVVGWQPRIRAFLPYTEDNMLTCEDWPLLQDARWLCWNICERENGSRTPRKFKAQAPL